MSEKDAFANTAIYPFIKMAICHYQLYSAGEGYIHFREDKRNNCGTSTL